MLPDATQPNPPRETIANSSTCRLPAFFTFLRANLVLSDSALSSCANTPVLEAVPHQHPAPLFSNPASPPSSLASSSSPLTPLDDIPPLSLETLDTEDERCEGLQLVADSIAQMRQRALRAVASHPLCLAGLGASLAAIYHLAVPSDPRLGLFLACGVTASYLLAIRHFTSGYGRLADQLHWSWLRSPDASGGDVVLGARYRNDLVGALVLRLQPNPSHSGPSTGGHARRKSRGGGSLRGGRGIIRAWTTHLRFRGRGMGRDLLESAVRFTKEKCGRDAEVGFAKEHANSVMILPDMFNGVFRRDEVRAAKALDAAVTEWEFTRKKR